MSYANRYRAAGMATPVDPGIDVSHYGAPYQGMLGLDFLSTPVAGFPVWAWGILGLGIAGAVTLGGGVVPNRRPRRNTGRVDAGRLDLFDARAMLRGLKKQLPPIRREIRKYQKEIDADDMRWADGDAEKIRNYRAYMRGVVQNYKNEVARLEKSIRELKKRHPQLRTKRAR